MIAPTLQPRFLAAAIAFAGVLGSLSGQEKEELEAKPKPDAKKNR